MSNGQKGILDFHIFKAVLRHPTCLRDCEREGQVGSWDVHPVELVMSLSPLPGHQGKPCGEPVRPPSSGSNEALLHLLDGVRSEKAEWRASPSPSNTTATPLKCEWRPSEKVELSSPARRSLPTLVSTEPSRELRFSLHLSVTRRLPSQSWLNHCR